MGKIVFVTGGVISSLGKGIIASSTARLLYDQGLSINMMKCDPYLNVDPGTMSPTEHGEVFVTFDGGETDLDVGHYERFLGVNLKKSSSLTTGRVYSEVLARERRGGYLGKTVQVIPHITDEIKKYILNNTKDNDVLFVEVGGTVGDIESLPYIEAIRQLMTEYPKDTFLIHASYVPYIKASKELKTKPTQHSVKELLGLGVRPNMIVTRNEIPLSDKERQKIAMFCNVDENYVIESVDVPSVYEVPLLMKKQDVDRKIASFFNLNLRGSEHSKLKEVVEKIYHQESTIKIAIVGKYIQLEDAYISVIESLKHGGIMNLVKVNIDLINSDGIDVQSLDEYNGVVVPGGFGANGIEGKLATIKYCRENNIPFLGICLGLQLSIIEFANNVCNLNVEHQEFSPDSTNAIIHLLKGQDLDNLGGTLRLGDYECQVKKGTIAYESYGKDNILERHRHRYEFNNDYKNILEDAGLVFSGINPETNLVEIIENPNNDFFVAVQFHPELSSKLTVPSPLFTKFIEISAKGK